MKTKQLFYFLIPLFCGVWNIAIGQNVITIDPNAANAVVNAQSTTKGFLFPRLTETQRNNMPSLVVGVVVYCTDCTSGAGPYIFVGAGWTPMFVPPSPPVAPAYTVGQSKFGGVIFFVDESGQHGLVASLADQSASVAWYNGNFTNTLAIRSGIYSGFYNTEQIISSQNTGAYAASVAVQATDGGYGDWYLPSKDEMSKMFQQIGVIPAITAGVNYWSSTEELASSGTTSLNAHQVILSTGVSSLSSKTLTSRVRAIRRF